MKKIPDNATKVFEGVIFDVYHWQQEMFDGSFATFEAVKRKDSVTIIAVVGDKIIINDEEQPAKPSFYALPGGQVEADLSVLDNAKRELLEETGYASEVWQEWFINDPSNMAKVEWNNHYFIAKNCEKKADQNLDSGEKIKVNLVTFEEFLEFRHNPKARNKDLFPILEKAATDEGERKKLQELLFTNN